jgi:DnaJ-class molecular chaperone
MSNPYTILEINKNADKNEITKAYKTLAKKYHPDKNKSPDATEKFKEINDAYTYLMDEKKKKFFDRTGRRLDESDGDGGFPEGFPGFPGFPGFHQQRQPSQEQMMEMKKKQLHINMKINVSLKQLYNGFKNTIQYKRVKISNGNQKEQIDSLEININPGFKTSDTHEIKNKGHILFENGVEIIGSVMITIEEEDTSSFTRDTKRPEHLRCNQDITFIEALCGFKKEIEHPSGDKVVVEYNDIIKQNKLYRVNNKGMPVYDRNNTFGDLLIKFNITYPEDSITDEQKKKLSELFNYKCGDCEGESNAMYEYEDEETESDEESGMSGMHGIPGFAGMGGQNVQCAQS